MTEEAADTGQSDLAQGTRTPVADLIALLSVVELVAVRFLEVSAKRILDEVREGFETTFEMQFLHRQSTDRLDLRFRMTAKSAEADYVVDLETSYSLASDVEIPPSVLAEFVERTGVMAAFPYVREALANLATRLGVEIPVLGLLRAGQFQVEISAPAEETPPLSPGSS